MIIREDKLYYALNDHITHSDTLLSRGLIPILDESGVVIAIYFNTPSCYFQRDRTHYLMQEDCIEERDQDFILLRSFPLPNIELSSHGYHNNMILVNSKELMLLRSTDVRGIHIAWYSLETGELIREKRSNDILERNIYLISDDLIFMASSVRKFEDFSVVVEVTRPKIFAKPDLLNFTRGFEYQYIEFMIDNRTNRGVIRITDGKRMDHDELWKLTSVGIFATNSYHVEKDLFQCHTVILPRSHTERRDHYFSDISSDQFRLTETWNLAINLPYIAYRNNNYSEEEGAECMVVLFNILTGEREYVYGTDESFAEYRLAIFRSVSKEFYLCYSENLEPGPVRDEGNMRTIIYDIHQKEMIFDRIHWGDGDGDPPIYSFDRDSNMIFVRMEMGRLISFSLDDHSINFTDSRQYPGSIGRLFPSYYFLIDNEVVILNSDHYSGIDEEQVEQFKSQRWYMEGQVAIRISESKVESEVH